MSITTNMKPQQRARTRKPAQRSPMALPESVSNPDAYRKSEAFFENLQPRTFPVTIHFATQEDADWAFKIASKQAGNPEQTMVGVHGSIFRSAVQHAVRVEQGNVNVEAGR